jgi:hypothetical protein
MKTFGKKSSPKLNVFENKSPKIEQIDFNLNEEQNEIFFFCFSGKEEISIYKQKSFI